MLNQNIRDKVLAIIFKVIMMFLAWWISVIVLFFVSMSIKSPEALDILSHGYRVLLLYVFFLIWSKKHRLKATVVFIGLECIAVFAFTSSLAKHAYIQSIPTVKDDIKLFEFEAYRGQRVATFNELSELQLQDDLPIIDCATALYPVASAFVQATYPEDNYPTFIVFEDQGFPVSCSGTATAYDRLIEGEVDIIFVARPSKEQLEAAEAAGVELIMTPIGREAFVFFVNKNNPVKNLTVDEVQQIYSGEITNWSMVGGNNAEIKAFQRNERSGSQTALAQFMQGKELMAAPKENIVADMGGIVEVVSDYRNFDNAIGFSFRFYSTEMVNNDEIRLLSLNGVTPDKESIRDGSYPISSDFYAVTTASSNANVEPLIEWILSPQGQFLIEETGYVGVEQ